MIGGDGRRPTGGPPDRIGGIADIMSLLSRASIDQVLFVFRETDLPTRGERMINDLSYKGSVGL
jgi:hypothetical protein